MVHSNLRQIKYFSKSSYKLKFEKKSVKEKYNADAYLVKKSEPTHIRLIFYIPSPTGYRDFPTFLSQGQGSVQLGKKAFGPSKLG